MKTNAFDVVVFDFFFPSQHQGTGSAGGASKKQESKDKEEDNFERTKVGV
jgi:hypothetical protein